MTVRPLLRGVFVALCILLPILLFALSIFSALYIALIWSSFGVAWIIAIKLHIRRKKSAINTTHGGK
jgi:hypothetical protein